MADKRSPVGGWPIIQGDYHTGDAKSPGQFTPWRPPSQLLQDTGKTLAKVHLSECSLVEALMQKAM